MPLSSIRKKLQNIRHEPCYIVQRDEQEANRFLDRVENVNNMIQMLLSSDKEKVLHEPKKHGNLDLFILQLFIFDLLPKGDFRARKIFNNFDPNICLR